MNCTGPDAGATLQVTGDLTPSSVTLPAEGFSCECVCNDTFPSNLGSVSVVMRAVDVATAAVPNYKYLNSHCSPPALQAQGQVYVTTCDSGSNPRLAVRSLSFYA